MTEYGCNSSHADLELEKRQRAAGRDLAAAGGDDARIEIVDYDAAWPERFAAEAQRLTGLAPDLAWHHIGSTAVPGLPAKPIIDMMALTDDLDGPLPCLVDGGGYEYPAAYNATLVARRWLCRPSASHRTHHLHLVAGREELGRHLRFRDILRADADVAAQYAALKRDLAARLPHDREGYSAAKTYFVRRIESGPAPG